MTSTRSRGQLIVSPDLELERTLHKMNRNLDILDEDHNPELPPSGDTHDQLFPENRGEGEIWRQRPAPCPQKYYKGYDNITDSYNPLVLPPPLHGHTLVVTCSLMKILTARGFSGLPFEDPHAHITKVMLVCKSCVGRSYFNMDVIG